MASQALDIGLGTTYERFALNGWLAQLADRYGFRAVLEGPGDGMTGIPGLNSLLFGRRGIDVLVVLQDEGAIELSRRGWQSQQCLEHVRFLCSPDGRIPVSADQFDLVWNFNRLPFLAPSELIREMVRVSRRYVLLLVPSRQNYGFAARVLHHRLTGKPWPYGNTEVMLPEEVINILSQFNLRVLETAWVDAPWWPDIIDLSEFVTELAPFLSRLVPERGPTGYRWSPEELPYFDPESYADLHRRIERLFFIERGRINWIKRLFAHHFGVLAIKQGVSR